ncbi:MAG: orotidine-5'-phosphate decarboxylase [Betaproteobacteria bacterium]|nr:orotidine-5'-phosphate decarboxylase [Betaproteobacteria bacterium]NCA16587.1 orotidine-5'-phosphate decarboxylase [Betaproteobacteria bacterium]
MRFSLRCQQAWAMSSSLLCVGLDPEPDRLPAELSQQPHLEAVEAFCRGIVEATAPSCCAFKPQIAHFAALGAEPVLERLSAWVKSKYPHHLWILDAKRGDIGSTASRYAQEAFDRYGADAVTLNPYLGSDSIAPFLERRDKGAFILCRTSNPGASELQNLALASGETLYEHVARLAHERWNAHDQIGLVVGATAPDELERVREIAPALPLLVPGIGTQGGDVKAVVSRAATTAGGLFINASRAILYAHAQQGVHSHWQEASAAAASALNSQIQHAR